MGNFGELLSLLPQGSDISASRRGVLLAPLVTAVMLAMARTVAQAGRLDPTMPMDVSDPSSRWPHRPGVSSCEP
jgi:hypothetical protein